MERVFGAADQISRLLFKDGLRNMDFSWLFSKGGVAAAVIAGVIALLMILAGAKCKYVLFVLQGLCTGVLIGLAVCWILDMDGWVMIGSSAAAAIVLAVLEAAFQRFGGFIFSAVVIFASGLALAGGRGYLVLGIGAAIALVFAIFVAVFGDPMLIPVMGIGGGVLGGIVASLYIPYDRTLVFYAASIVLAVVGICIQYALKSSKIAKMERKKVREIRAKKSVESEIELARNILDSDTGTKKDR